jgi:hypothetical protein
MTEEMEKKLNELLGMKKQLDELTLEKGKLDANSAFDEQTRKIKKHFYIWLALTIIIMLVGVIGLLLNSGKYQIISLFYALLGFEGSILMKIWYHTMATKLAILKEMKQFELRITEILKKNSADS